MNKHIQKVFIGAALFGAVACTDRYEDYNTNPTDATKDEMMRDGFNISADLVNMQSCVIPTNTHKFQYLECLMGGPYGGYVTDVNPGFFSKCFASYAPIPGWYRWPFEEVVPDLYPAYRGVYTNSTDEVILAVADILKVASMHRMTDWFGPIPYTKILDSALNAEYDSQRVVYETMFAELDKAIEVLVQHQIETFNPKADRVFAGSVAKWAKYANSMRLRMAIRVAYADAAMGKTQAEKALASEAGLIDSNADNANFMLASKSPLRTIMTEYNGGGDTRVCADITQYMLSYEDPRLEKYFVPSSFIASDNASVNNTYHGIRTGIKIGNMGQAQRYANINIDTFDGKNTWMTAAEVNFLKAEAALRGWIGGSAKDFYEQGIRLSFEQFGANGVDAYVTNNSLTPQPYEDPVGLYNYSGLISGITIAWDDAATEEESLERIITQKWIAMFPNGNEAWAEYRRTGYPKLMDVVVNNSTVVSTEDHVRRIAYPQSEYQKNYENLSKILPTLGGPDNMATRVWWDAKQ